jgi:hypothetical protein
MPCPRILLLALLLLSSACGPKVTVEPVYESDEVDVVLRRTVHRGEPVSRDYAHPLVISDVRLAHILAQLSYEDRSGASAPAVDSQHVYSLAEGMSRALGRASPADQVIATAFISERRFGIFSRVLVTSFRAYLEGDFLAIEFFAIAERVEKDPRNLDRKNYKPPEELPTRGEPTRMLPGQGVMTRGPRGVLIDWRDPHFGKPVSLSARGGKLRRRTILMEEQPEGEAGTDLPESLPPGRLTDHQLRALDQLDAARRAGWVTEGEFQRRRRLILEGRLEEAGYELQDEPDE